MFKVPVSSRVPAPPWVGSRSPHGWDQITYRPGGWVLHQSPWSFGFDSQTRGTRENRRTLCLKYQFPHGSQPASPATETQGHCPRLHLRVDMNNLEEQADNTKASELFWKPLSWLRAIRPTSANYALDPALWETFVSTTLGLEVPILAALPRLHNSPLAKCGCKKFCMDFHGDHTSTCTAHSGATKAHDWMVSVLGPLFRTAGHTVRTQHGVTASAGQRRGDVEIRNYLRSQAGSRSLVFDLSIAHDRSGSSSHVQQNGCLSHPQYLDAPLRIAAQRKIAAYQQQYADNQNISFLPAIVEYLHPHAWRVSASSFSTGPPGD